MVFIKDVFEARLWEFGAFRGMLENLMRQSPKQARDTVLFASILAIASAQLVVAVDAYIGLLPD
ncbi:hypothetical protein [Rhizobium giardinii]|uniref:Uncharacterized protein n=1 Tax=Rhizobium giardinii TaxID=56731 RepID=A0A7W8UA67_9HYPH|nr:hypothetical protein [Rhizobium giardinii]MBB5535666.1 hypothetical protein [Rhizobium giardinii]